MRIVSFHRENIIWRSADSTWSRGFYESWPTGSYDDEDYDPEWDCEYGDQFEWVTTGHPSVDAADRAWNGANPGGYVVMDADGTNQEHLDDLDARLVAAHQASVDHRGVSWNGPAPSQPILDRAHRHRLKEAVRLAEWEHQRDTETANAPDRRARNLRGWYDSPDRRPSPADLEAAAAKVTVARAELEAFDNSPSATAFMTSRGAVAPTRASSTGAQGRDSLGQFTETTRTEPSVQI